MARELPVEWAKCLREKTYALQRERDTFRALWIERRDAHLAALAALLEIQQKQSEMVVIYRANGIVFDGPLGTDPNNWQHVAFSTYTKLCEVESIARAALDEPLG